jgi:hypothetical protein
MCFSGSANDPIKKATVCDRNLFYNPRKTANVLFIYLSRLVEQFCPRLTVLVLCLASVAVAAAQIAL